MSSEPELQARVEELERDLAVKQGVIDGNLVVRPDPGCSVCGGSGAAPDSSTCDCVGWKAREQLEEVQRLQEGIRRFYVAWAPHLPRSWREHFTELMGDGTPFLGRRSL